MPGSQIWQQERTRSAYQTTMLSPIYSGKALSKLIQRSSEAELSRYNKHITKKSNFEIIWNLSQTKDNDGFGSVSSN